MSCKVFEKTSAIQIAPWIPSILCYVMFYSIPNLSLFCGWEEQVIVLANDQHDLRFEMEHGTCRKPVRLH